MATRSGSGERSSRVVSVSDGQAIVSVETPGIVLGFVVAHAPSDLVGSGK